jgi:putative transposase
MPNHIHGILVIGAVVGATPRGCPVLSARGCPVSSPQKNGHKHGEPDQCGQVCENGYENGQAQGDQEGGQARGPAPTGNTGALSLGDIVHRFKTMTTKRYVDGVKQSGWRSFAGRLWQRNYWEHVIRNEMELNRIREYIRDNPAQWEDDHLNAPMGDPHGRRNTASYWSKRYEEFGQVVHDHILDVKKGEMIRNAGE